MAAQKENKLWLVVKTVTVTAGLIYMVHLLSWFIHWGVVLTALGAMGFIGYRVANALHSKSVTETKLLSNFDQKMARLDAEDRLLDKKIGIR